MIMKTNETNNNEGDEGKDRQQSDKYIPVDSIIVNLIAFLSESSENTA